MSIYRKIRRFTRELGWHRRQRQGAAPEDFEGQLYQAIVEPGDVCLDVGANRGDVSLALAALAGPRGAVVACEPVPPMYAQLCENIQDIRGDFAAHITTLPVGAADTRMERQISVPRGVFAKGSMAASDEWSRVQDTAEMSHYSCVFWPVDDIVERWCPRRPDFLKVDVEGAELLVVRGAEALLAAPNHPIVLMELFAPWEAAFGYTPWDVLQLLLKHGYEIFFVCPEGLVNHQPSAEAPFPPEFERGYNIIAVDPREHSSRLERLRHYQRGAGATIKRMGSAPMPNRVESQPSALSR